MVAFLFRHTFVAGKYQHKTIGCGAGYWLWLASAGLVIVSGTTGLQKQR